MSRRAVAAPWRTPSPRAPSRTTSPRYGSPPPPSISGSGQSSGALSTRSPGTRLRDLDRSQSAPPTNFHPRNREQALLPFVHHLEIVLGFDDLNASQSLTYYLLNPAIDWDAVVQHLDAAFQARLMDVLHLVSVPLVRPLLID
jgi:hypothetical protein